jgi:glucuronate isomerase
MELQRYFGIKETLNAQNSDNVYNICNEALGQESHKVLGLLNGMKVKLIGTTDDPVDSLEHHVSYKNSGQEGPLMVPSFRPDKFILIENDSFITSIEKLAELTHREINDVDSLMQALAERANYFNSLGCRASDHGLSYIDQIDYNVEQVDSIFKKKMMRNALDEHEIAAFKSYMLYELCKLYHDRGWAQQFHLGAMRNNNLQALRTMGPDTGWDSIGDWPQASSLSRLLGRLVEQNKLAKTIIYNLNPSYNEVMATMIGNFNDGSLKGKIQFGSGWWFLDQKDGMEKQINALSNMGLISCFIGMLTDSRSFLSFPRHEYFRRILCNIFGNEIEKGELPNDIDWIGNMIQDICYNNAKEYFGV